MLESMTSRQWVEWIAFYDVEPWGFEFDRALREVDQEQTAHYLAALMATIANFSRKFKKANWTARDFMPWKKEKTKPTNQESPAVLNEKAKAIFRALGAVEVKRNGDAR